MSQPTEPGVVLDAVIGTAATDRLLQQTCERIGAGLRRHAGPALPAPTTLRGATVVVDVGSDTADRLPWCGRIKDLAPDSKLVLLLEQPTRDLLVRALRCRPDALLSLPVDEPAFAARLLAITKR